MLIWIHLSSVDRRIGSSIAAHSHESIAERCFTDRLRSVQGFQMNRWYFLAIASLDMYVAST